MGQVMRSILLFIAGILTGLLLTSNASAMSKASMQSLVTAITNAGFSAQVILKSDGTWNVRSATTDGFTVNVNAIKALADGQGVSAFVAEVEYR